MTKLKQTLRKRERAKRKVNAGAVLIRKESKRILEDLVGLDKLVVNALNSPAALNHLIADEELKAAGDADKINQLISIMQTDIARFETQLVATRTRYTKDTRFDSVEGYQLASSVGLELSNILESINQTVAITALELGVELAKAKNNILAAGKAGTAANPVLTAEEV
jgi:hypothetical protein